MKTANRIYENIATSVTNDRKKSKPEAYTGSSYKDEWGLDDIPF
jgi:hypothetical protein